MSGKTRVTEVVPHVIIANIGTMNGAEMSNEILAVEVRGKVSVLTMTHSPHNLMGPTMYRALIAAFAEAVERGSRAILLRSALRHFSAGAEVNLFPERIAKEGKALMDPVETLRAFETLPIPIV